MFNQNKENRNRLNLFLMKYFVLIVLVVSALTIYFGYFFVVKPKESDIESNIKIAISEKERDIIVLEGVLNKINDFQSAYGRISEAEKKRLDVLLPLSRSRDNLFSDIENMILRQGLIIESIEIEEKTDSSRNSRTREAAAENSSAGVTAVGELNIFLKISEVGNYEKMKQVLALFENNLRLMDISKIDFDFESGIIELEIKTYFLKT